jgi:hypothetical protein
MIKSVSGHEILVAKGYCELKNPCMPRVMAKKEKEKNWTQAD